MLCVVIAMLFIQAIAGAVKIVVFLTTLYLDSHGPFMQGSREIQKLSLFLASESPGCSMTGGK